ncbi:hypothetical protein [Oceanobacillus senegalensis]|uniref:hypothetical protein n=1 Tax=Oceanobacillus senegalensis TaxID=1936063 RepID=UPI000A3121B6|nr:hypothetical protein [Oceanobacillus senegalensis]
MGNLRISQYLYIYYSFVFILHIFNVFLQNEVLNYIIGVLAIVMLIISFQGASGLFRILGLIFIAVGGIVFTTTSYSILDIPELMTSNVSLLTLLAMLPWMNSVVRSGRFDRSLNNLLNANVSNLGNLYPRSSATTLTLAAFLNLSAAIISQDVLKKNLSSLNKKIKDSFISTATLRGYTLALLWSPLEILLAVSIFTTGVDYVSLLPWLLLIAFITYVLDSLWGKFYFRKVDYNPSNTKIIDKKKLMSKLIHLMVALVLFLTLVITLGSLLNLDFIFTVTILIFPFAAIWSLLMKRFRSFWAIGWKTWKEKTNTMQNFIVLFISLAFFANSIDGTPFLDFIQTPIIAFLDYPFVIFICIQLIFIFLSLFGVHPIATIGILSGVIATLLEFLNPVSLAIVLATSAVATLTVGSYGLIVQLTSMNTGQNPYRITMLNLPYAFTCGLVGSIVAYLLL